MKISENLRARAAYIAKHGFCAAYGTTDGPACFLGAREFAGLPDSPDNWRAESFLRNTIFDGDSQWRKWDSLHGWDADDAVAALDIAADIATCEGL